MLRRARGPAFAAPLASADVSDALSADETGAGSGDGKAAEGDFSERLKRLQTQLDRKGGSPASGSSSRARSGGISPLGQAMRLSSEFVGGAVVGGLLGWGFDWLLGTKPWGLMGFLLLGFAAGIYNVMRSSGFIGPTVAKARQDAARQDAARAKNEPEGP